MEERNTIIDYLAQVLSIFGFNILFMAVATVLVGEDAKSYILFSLGEQGIPVKLIFQFLLLSIVIIFLKFLLFTDYLVKRLSLVKRTGIMGVLVLIIGSIFLVVFKWFPITMWRAWAGFFICFVICFIASILITGIKNHLENKKLEDGLNRLQGQWRGKDEK